MSTSRSSRGNSKPEASPKTVQRTYRFDNKTFTAFEDDCAQHLSNPKRVIEAKRVVDVRPDLQPPASDHDGGG
jgi:hypothetical protein